MDFEQTYQWYEYFSRTGSKWSDKWAARYALRELRNIANGDVSNDSAEQIVDEALDLIGNLSYAQRIQSRNLEMHFESKLVDIGVYGRCMLDLLFRYESGKLTRRKATNILYKYGVIDY